MIKIERKCHYIVRPKCGGAKPYSCPSYLKCGGAFAPSAPPVPPPMPITLLEVPGKVYERIINDRFKRFCETNDLFNTNQFGFRANKGTDVALAAIYEFIANTQVERQQCCVIARDISKAFDKVWHTGLQYKILTLDLPPVIEKTLCNFVEDRTAQIRHQDIIGPKFEIKCGVPQGAITSPSLYIWYINDMPIAEPRSLNVMFADDVTEIIVTPERSKDYLKLKAEREITKINNFEKKWKLKTNYDKFKLLSISKTKPPIINIEGRPLAYSNEVTILGQTFKRTGIGKHTDVRLRLARAANTKLKRFSGLQVKTKLHLFKAFVRSTLEYPAPLMNILSRTNKIKMQRLQNKCLREITKNNQEDQDLNTQALHEKYNIQPINVRLWERAKRCWDKLEHIQPQICDRAREISEQDRRIFPEHKWWRRMYESQLGDEEPEAIYVYTDAVPNANINGNRGD